MGLILSLLGLLATLTDKFLSFLLQHKPQVTCDICGVYKAHWGPDYFPDELGVVEGIEIRVPVNFLLANNGSVGTTIKNAYIKVRYARNKSTILSNAGIRVKLQVIEIGPRKTLGPYMVKFSGSLWDVYEPPKDLRAELIVEPVAQRPIRRPINLFL